MSVYLFICMCATKELDTDRFKGWMCDVFGCVCMC